MMEKSFRSVATMKFSLPTIFFIKALKKILRDKKYLKVFGRHPAVLSRQQFLLHGSVALCKCFEVVPRLIDFPVLVSSMINAGW